MIQCISMSEIFAFAQCQPDTTRFSAEPSDIRRARQFIQQNYADVMSLTNTARVAGLSRGHFSEKFKRITGMNFVEYVERVRFEHACRRLYGSNERVSEIAFESGFQSLSQFNRVFKKFTGKTP